MNDWFHYNCTVLNSAFLSSFGTKIWHVLYFHSKSRNNVPAETWRARAVLAVCKAMQAQSLIMDLLCTSWNWQLPRLGGSYGETCLAMDTGHYLAHTSCFVHSNLPLHQVAHVEVSPSINLKLISREIIFEVFQLMWSRYPNVTDGQTDGQMDGQTPYCGITALCLTSRGNKQKAGIGPHVIWFFCSGWSGLIL